MQLAPGARIGHYEIVSLLGEGGMGRVYRAWDTRLERDVAVKVLSDDARDTARQALREARAASALNHPGICTLHEAGESDGLPFLVMEFVDGETLDRRIPENGLPAAEVIRIGAAVADALAHAHSRGVIHRDLKCANVALTADRRPRILDFGIARRVSTGTLAETAAASSILEAGTIAGTLHYMAPEVLQGQPADARSDLWALGVMLVEMASGRRPFDGATALALSSAILRDPPQIPPTVPRELAAIARRLLAKDPADRPGSAAETAAALRAITARPQEGTGVRRGVRIALAAAVVLALGLAAWPLLSGWRAGMGNRSIGAIAVLPLGDDSPNADQGYLADGMTEAIISQLSAFDDLRVISRTSVMRFRGTTEPLAQIARTLGVDAVVEGAVLQAAERVRITARLIDVRTERPIWRGEYEEPLGDAIALQREIAAAIGREIRGELTASERERLERRTEVDPQAYLAYLRGRSHWNRRGREDLTLAAAAFEEAIRRDPGFASAYAGLADVYVLLGDFRDMLPATAYARARDAVNEALELDPQLAEAHTTRGWLAFAVDRDWSLAEHSLARAIELNPGYATAHQWRGELLTALGRFDDALESLARAQALDPLAPMPQAVRGWAAYLARRYEEALALCEGVLARDPRFRPARLYRAWTFMELGQLDEAERETQLVLEQPTSRAVPVATLGRIAARRGDRTAAERAIQELKALEYPPSFDIAKVLAELGDRDEALTWLERSAQEQNSAVLYIDVDPSFTELRSESRFQALRATLRLAAIQP